MKRCFVYPVLFAFLLISCQKVNTGSSQDSTSVLPAPANYPGTLGQGKHCYQNINDKDKAYIQFQINNGQVSGFMRFDNFQKPSFRGAINGKIKGDIINVVYRFKIDGMTTIRNLNMKLVGEQIVFGIGKEESLRDSAFISDKSTIKYEGMKFKKMNCDK